MQEGRRAGQRRRRLRKGIVGRLLIDVSWLLSSTLAGWSSIASVSFDVFGKGTEGYGFPWVFLVGIFYVSCIRCPRKGRLRVVFSVSLVWTIRRLRKGGTMFSTPVYLVGLRVCVGPWASVSARAMHRCCAAVFLSYVFGWIQVQNAITRSDGASAYAEARFFSFCLVTAAAAYLTA